MKFTTITIKSLLSLSVAILGFNATSAHAQHYASHTSDTYVEPSETYVEPTSKDYRCDHFSKTGDTVCYDSQGNRIGISQGYSGQPAFKNNPAYESWKNSGPIPSGNYNVTGTQQTLNGKASGNVLRLEPTAGTNTYGRDAFRMHGDYSDYRRGSASNGCIVTEPGLRGTLTGRTNAGGTGSVTVRPTYPQTYAPAPAPTYRYNYGRTSTR